MAVGPRKNWIVAKCGHGDTYYFYLEKRYNIKTDVCGPQWTALCEAYIWQTLGLAAWYASLC